ncbi:hypothetical protein QTP86_024480, partial [Hemibagrus guttatus]
KPVAAASSMLDPIVTVPPAVKTGLSGGNPGAIVAKPTGDKAGTSDHQLNTSICGGTITLPDKKQDYWSVNTKLQYPIYADDVAVMVNEQRDVDILTGIIRKFNVISSTKVNCKKVKPF